MTGNTEILTKALLDSLHLHRHAIHGKRVWLACSGGRDSMSLAILCKKLFDQGKLPFLPQLLHINHGMQEANTAWSKQVNAWANQEGLPCQVLTLALDKKSEVSARNARYHAMMQIMNSDDVLMLGHHQDDQVETVLMRLFNGAGVTGLGGMRDWSIKHNTSVKNLSQNEIDYQPSEKIVYLWRPWLTVSRAQITEYAESENLEYIDDPTNTLNCSSSKTNHSDTLYQDVLSQEIAHDQVNDRAWLRSVLMPLIIERYPQAQTAIARSSQLLQAADQIVKEQVATDLNYVSLNTIFLKSENLSNQLVIKVADKNQKKGVLQQTEWQSMLCISKLQELSHQRQSSLIHTWLSPSINEAAPSKRLVEDVLQLINRDNPDHQTSLHWNSGLQQYEIRRFRNYLYRLQQSWLDWLDIPPKMQHFDVTLESLNELPYSVSLKSQDIEQQATYYDWQLQGIHKLAREIRHSSEFKHYIDSATKDKQATLVLEPLPRHVKLALWKREGRKSGKKLLQALDQPSFQRESVILCSMQNNVELQNSVPLFIITIDAIVILESPFATLIERLTQHEQLNSQLKKTNFNSI